MPQPKSKWTNQFTVLNTSNFHEKVRQIFVEDSFFKNLSCYQEVQISSLVPAYSSNQHCADWYIDELRVVIELHGKQHYSRSNFGNSAYDQSVKDFNNIKYRDNLKKTALLEAGYEYIEISYKEINKLTPQYLKDKIFKNGQ